MHAYVIGDVLIDAGMKGSAKKIIKALDGEKLSALALTHAHIDHVGGAKGVCEHFGVELWAGEADIPAVEAGKQHGMKVGGGFPAFPVGRALSEGDTVADFTVLDTPGHSPGHVSYWRESDRVLICGDVWLNMSVITTRPGLHDPPGMATPDPAQNKESQKKLAALEPSIVLFGHGPVLSEGAAEKLAAAAG